MANHGTVSSKKGGFTYMESFGMDKSDYNGSASEERGNTGQKGSCTDLSHTLTGGGSANQKGS